MQTSHISISQSNDIVYTHALLIVTKKSHGDIIDKTGIIENPGTQ